MAIVELALLLSSMQATYSHPSWVRETRSCYPWVDKSSKETKLGGIIGKIDNE